jgi:hypothetical protein
MNEPSLAAYLVCAILHEAAVSRQLSAVRKNSFLLILVIPNPRKRERNLLFAGGAGAASESSACPELAEGFLGGCATSG